VLLLLAFMLGAMLLSIWELRRGPKWSSSVVLVVCAVVALGFLSLRIV
jgi:hypothetical protein